MKTLFLLILSLFMVLRIDAQANTFGERDFREIFLKEFKARFNQPGGEISLEKFRIEPAELNIPKGTPYKIEWVGSTKAGSNSAILIFRLVGNEEKIVRLWGYVEVKVPVVIVKNNLSNKVIISEADLTFEKRELSRLPHDVLFKIEDAIGQETRTGLKAGTVLRASHLSQPLMIRRNQEVEIIAQGRGFMVKAKGIALQNGKLEQYIPVKNISSQKVVQAKVIGEGKVEVSY